MANGDFFDYWDAIVGGSGAQTKAQLEVVAMQQEQEKLEAELKYNPKRIAEQRKLIIAVAVSIAVLGLGVFLVNRYLK